MKSSEVRPQYFYIEGNGIRGGGGKKTNAVKKFPSYAGKVRLLD